ncbi:MAG: biopolymer transporter ExbD [Myxococcales bacterium]|nr:biopolymer transporter ExbD [Myxococcales bacterium]MCB9530879.1 biopolymer transporter ExbD [Myxococcales bacterium]MCB9534335.1 biopolymer transporter ExbD [Myxococcales bacterium]
MGRRRPASTEEAVELNLAPIMNMVMILVPLLLLSSVFIKAGVVNVSSPRRADASRAESEERPEEPAVPRVVVSIGRDGFRISDQRNLGSFAPFAQPVARCANQRSGSASAPGDTRELPPTVCLRDDAGAGADLLAALDFGGLYNRLAEIRLQSEWFVGFGEEGGSVISVLADPDIPFEVLVATMDTARYLLRPGDRPLLAPTASSDVTAYMLGGGHPTPEDLGRAQYIESSGASVPMFRDVVLVLPRPTAGG